MHATIPDAVIIGVDTHKDVHLAVAVACGTSASRQQLRFSSR
jgi:hypothetical protein